MTSRRPNRIHRALRAHRAPLLAAAVTTALSLTVPPALATPVDPIDLAPKAQPKAPGKAGPEDFDGDGYRDLAVGAPGGTVNGKERVGHVSVLYGSASPTLPGRRQLIHQDQPGIPGTAESGNAFGAGLATGDLDRDGFTDLVVGAPIERNGPGRPASPLTVLWGGPKGLSGAAHLPDGADAETSLGKHVVAADLDGDGDQDVATVEGTGSLRVLSGPFGRDGSAAGVSVRTETDHFILDLAAGDIDGDGRTDLAAVRHFFEEGDSRHLAVWRGTRQGPAGRPQVVPGTAGWTLAGGDQLDVGDIDRDGYEDIVMGRSDGYDNDPTVPRAKGGVVTFVPGSKRGAIGERAVHINQDSPGVPGTATPDDHFGSGVSVADIDGDGYEDVAAGVRAKEVGGVRDAGAVVTLHGSAKGLRSTGARSFTQSTAGVPGVSEPWDFFGSNTKLADLNGDRRAELAVAAGGENGRAGAVWVFRATKSGITANGSVTFGNGAMGAVAAPRSDLGGAFAQ
ncbi:FG-GAP-like repeat-containing protein [Streptomyces sp. NPDC000594]|uniref:FG-GAP-like repeat-containing protein n=1 Tax=Streptomyces sp. NPDC000594 TaxID=3154261 RepID=UPI003326914C